VVWCEGVSFAVEGGGEEGGKEEGGSTECSATTDLEPGGRAI